MLARTASRNVIASRNMSCLVKIFEFWLHPPAPEKNVSVSASCFVRFNSDFLCNILIFCTQAHYLQCFRDGFGDVF